MIKRPARSLSIGFLVLLLFLPMASARVAADPALAIIELQHRPASEVMPWIEPLLRPGEVLTGTGFQLFMRSGPDTLAEVRELLSAVDRAARNLVVTVRRGASDAALGRGIGIEYPGEGPGVRWTHRRGTGRDEGLQTVRILEGGQAFIRAGESVPHPAHLVLLLPRADALAFGFDYQDLERGFLVRPWVEPNDRIRLEIQYVHEREGRSGGGRIDRQRVDTVLSGPVGEWISITHGDDLHQNTERWILGTRSLRERQDVQIQVRVDLAE
jgi:hypothetical protein